MSHPSEPSGRPAGSQADPAYALARSRAEYERLSRQAAFLRGTTEQLFRAAGLEPGMRILEVGSGAGDVALLAAELVGPEGEVVGVDVDGAALEIARGRAQSLGLGNVSFVEGDARTAELEGGFDAAVGRLVVMYWGDPTEGLRRIAAHVRPGGVVAVQELDLDPATGPRSLPEETLWNETGQLVIETFARAGMRMRMGRELFGAFLAAGLPAPNMRDERHSSVAARTSEAMPGSPASPVVSPRSWRSLRSPMWTSSSSTASPIASATTPSPAARLYGYRRSWARMPAGRSDDRRERRAMASSLRFGGFHRGRPTMEIPGRTLRTRPEFGRAWRSRGYAQRCGLRPGGRPQPPPHHRAWRVWLTTLFVG